jgi:vacuolar protein sorting-associated protein IST1
MDRLDLLSGLSSFSDPPKSVPTTTTTQPSKRPDQSTSSAAPPPTGDGDGLPDLDALTRRFEALRDRR